MVVNIVDNVRNIFLIYLVKVVCDSIVVFYWIKREVFIGSLLEIDFVRLMERNLLNGDMLIVIKV